MPGGTDFDMATFFLTGITFLSRYSSRYSTIEGLSIYNIPTPHGHVDPYSCLSTVLVGFLLVTRNLRELTPPLL